MAFRSCSVKKRFFFLAALVIASFAWPAIPSYASGPEGETQNVRQAFPVTQDVFITDDDGTLIRLSAPARRIIPLYAALTESLVALGQEDHIAARTASDAEFVPHLPVVGTHMRPNLELIAGLQPDLILLMGERESVDSTAERLRSMGFVVARFRVNSFDDLFSCILRLGVLTGARDRAEALVTRYKDRLQTVRSSAARLAARPSVFFEVRYPNLLGAGGNSILSDIIRTAGGTNSLESYPDKLVRLNEEMLFSLNPDIYLVQEGAMNKNPLHPKERPHFRSLAALRSGSALLVPESLFSRPGPSSITAAELLGLYIRIRDAHGKTIQPRQ